MAENVYLPRLGQTMKEGTLVQWLKKGGDPVKKGDELYTLEYDKATINVESTADGILKIEIEDGATVEVGTVVAVILEPNEAAGRASDDNAGNAKAEGRLPGSGGRVKSSPLARKIAGERGIDLKIFQGRTKIITSKDLLEYIREIPGKDKAHEIPAEKTDRLKVSPLAKKLADDYGIDLMKVKAGDPSGRISKDDVLDYYEKTKKACMDATPAGTGVVAEKGPVSRTPLSPVRKVIAQRMCQSAFTAPTVTYCTDVDMTEMKRMREKLNGVLSSGFRKVSFNDLVIKAVAIALKQNPHINVSLQDDYIFYQNEINIGMAVATDRGLLVPVIKGADKLTFSEISAKAQELSGKAREGTLSGSEMTGGSFTISNLGMLDIDVFTPIINQPESAILGVGRIIDKPVVVENEITIRPMMVLSLTADHRVIDGAPAAEFLREIRKLMECPYLMMR